MRARGAPGRLQRVSGESGPFQVFVDYAHTHDALENVLSALRATMRVGSSGPAAHDIGDLAYPRTPPAAGNRHPVDATRIAAGLIHAMNNQKGALR